MLYWGLCEHHVHARGPPAGATGGREGQTLKVGVSAQFCLILSQYVLRELLIDIGGHATIWVILHYMVMEPHIMVPTRAVNA